jgi:hypothetical protein
MDQVKAFCAVEEADRRQEQHNRGALLPLHEPRAAKLVLTKPFMR